jgi:hypothetical protein
MYSRAAPNHAMHDAIVRAAPPGSTPGQLIVRFAAKSLILLIVVLGISIVSAFRASVVTPEPTLRVIWCVASIVTLFLYVRELRPDQLKKRKAMSVGVLSALIAWGFSVYLCFYLGVWRLALLPWHFSFRQLLIGIFWVFVGYRLAHWLWLLSKVGVSEKEKHES